MWRYSISSLDKLDELKEAERCAWEEEAKKRALDTPAPDPFDFLSNKEYLNL